MPIDDESGEFIPPQKTYLDDIEVYDAELGGVVPAWKSSFIMEPRRDVSRSSALTARVTLTKPRARVARRPSLPTPLRRPRPT